MTNGPSTTEQFDQLKRQISERLYELDGDVSFWRPRAFAGHVSIATLGALITLFAGVKSPDWSAPSWVPTLLLEKQNWILLFGSLITVVSAWQTFYGHRDRWLSYAAAGGRLRSLLARSGLSVMPPQFH